MKDIEKKLFEAADKLRNNIDAAEYKHVVLGLIFLKYISDKFEDLRVKLLAGETVAGEVTPDELEDRDLYIMNSAFYVPEKARWSFLKDHAKSPEIGLFIDAAMDAIEADNKQQLQGVLPKVYAKENLDKASLGGLIDIISTITLVGQQQSADILGHVFEYFLGQFALAEGKLGGQFYTPKSVVTLLVEMLEPYKGRVMDPCCGSGGMFVQSEKFVEGHQGRIDDISIYGQESNQTTWKLCKMNLAIRGIDASQVKWNSEGSFLKNEHKDVRVDYILANPPFNVSDWSGDLLREDGRWKYGTPPVGNANYAWLQHFLYHLAPNGRAGVVLSKGALTTNSSGEDVIRKNMIEAGTVECIVNLPAKLFLNTGIPACLWFLRKEGSKSSRSGEILFIDARDKGHMVTRALREFSDKDIQSVAEVYHNWRTGEGSYEDVAGFCKSVSIEEVKKLDYVLTPGRYVGLAEEEDDFNFKERFLALKAEFEAQLQEEQDLNKRISENLLKIQIDE
jgi:type I restriction enzyme M protein